jgi:hypothetical protein
VGGFLWGAGAVCHGDDVATEGDEAVRVNHERMVRPFAFPVRP